MQNNKSVYITLNHMDDFMDYPEFIRVGQELTLRKQKDNAYDDEAIVALSSNHKCAYVANSVSTVARGTYSAGRIYDPFEDETKCVVRFVLMEQGTVIAETNQRSVSK